MKFVGFSARTRAVRWGLLAVSLGIVLGATVPQALGALGNAVLAQPDKLAWYAERLVGFLAYFALAGSVVYGLLLSTKLIDTRSQRAITFSLHQDLAAVGLGLAAVHGALLALDHTMPFTFAQISIPFAAPYRPIWVGVGQLAFYAALVVVWSFYARRRIGQRAWRSLHYLTFLAFLGATAHGLASGTDSGTAWAWWTYVGAGMAVAFLLTYRVSLAAVRRSGRGAAPQAPLSSKPTSST